MVTCMTTSNQCIFTELFFLQAAGVSLQSNMFQPNPPYRPRPSIWDRRPFFGNPCEFQYLFIARDCHLLIPANIVCTLGLDILFDAPPALPVPEAGTQAPAPTSAPDGEEGGDGEGARTFFPESWIWSIQETE